VSSSAPSRKRSNDDPEAIGHSIVIAGLDPAIHRL
jgi:hypothetical protein